MRFYGRETELKKLRSIRESSESGSRFTVVTGRRRIGKTSLILKSTENTRFVYIFISRISQPLLCQDIQTELERQGFSISGTLTKFGDVLRSLMTMSKQDPLTLIIDEFQDLEYVDKSIFQDIQNVWDRYKDESRINLIVCGSAHSMMTRIFENDKEPLFGRPTHKIVLNPLPISVMENALRDCNPDYTSHDLLTLFMLTGGIPKYMETLIDGGAFTSEAMLDNAFSLGSVFLADGKDMLITEFGKEYRTYSSILQIISSGKEKRSEIEDVLGMEVGVYLKNLEEEYGLLKHISPVFSRPDGRNTRWTLSDMYLRFYFRFVRPSSSFIESGRFDLARRAAEYVLPDYEGQVLEDFFKRRITEEDTYTQVGSYWNRKGDVEIDIVVVDDISNIIRFIEVKRNPKKLDTAVLAAKCDLINHNTDRYNIGYEGLSIDDVKRDP